MRIIGFGFKSINADRKNPVKGKVEIASNINIENIEKEEVAITEKNSLKMDFNYAIDYKPNIAKIEIKGFVILMDEKDESKEILKEWKKKNFTHSIKVPVFNFIMDKCTIKALSLEEELKLPYHIPLPKVASPDSQDPNSKPNYAG